MGVAPDGGPVQSRAHPALRAQETPARLAILLADRGFVTLSAAIVLAMFSQVGVTAHLITHLASQVGPVSGRRRQPRRRIGCQRAGAAWHAAG
jgi:hypothetical protein